MHSWRAVWFRSSLGYRKWRWSALQLRCAKTVHKVGDTNKTWGDLFGKKSKEEWKKIASVPRNEALGDQRSWGANRKGRRNPWADRFVLFLFVRSNQAFESRTEAAYHIKMDWERMRKINGINVKCLSSTSQMSHFWYDFEPCKFQTKFPACYQNFRGIFLIDACRLPLVSDFLGAVLNVCGVKKYFENWKTDKKYFENLTKVCGFFI